MVFLANLQVNVEVEGKALTEYDDDDSEHPTGLDHTTKYIETIAGKPFSIHVQSKGFRLSPDNHVRWEVFLDGKKVDDSLAKWKDPSEKHDVFIRTARFCEEDRWIERDFMFADLQYRDLESGETPKDVKERFERLGQIEIAFWRYIKKTERKAEARADRAQWSTPEMADKVPEKAVKGQAISISASLGKARVAEPILLVSGVNVSRTPFATFIFKYRSRKDLQDLLIIPQIPAPVPLEDQPVETLSQEEAQELIRRQRARSAAARRIKLEPKTGVKRERKEANSLDTPNKRRTVGDSDSNQDAVDEGEIEIISVSTKNCDKEIEVIDLSED